LWNGKDKHDDRNISSWLNFTDHNGNWTGPANWTNFGNLTFNVSNHKNNQSSDKQFEHNLDKNGSH